MTQTTLSTKSALYSGCPRSGTQGHIYGSQLNNHGSSPASTFSQALQTLLQPEILNLGAFLALSSLIDVGREMQLAVHPAKTHLVSPSSLQLLKHNGER